jgi:hypothetical protein
MTWFLERSGESVNRKRVRRLMVIMGLEAVHPHPLTSVVAPDATVYPDLLRDRVPIPSARNQRAPPAACRRRTRWPPPSSPHSAWKRAEIPRQD